MTMWSLLPTGSQEVRLVIIFSSFVRTRSNSDENCDAQNWVGNGHVGISIDQTEVLGIN